MIVCIEFVEGQNFLDEVVVKVWLEDGGYENFVIFIVDGGWDVVFKFEVEIDGWFFLIQFGDGYFVYVVKLKGYEEFVEEGVEEKVVIIGVVVEDL